MMEELERVSCIGFASIHCISLASVTFVRPHKYHSLFVGCAGFIRVFFLCPNRLEEQIKKKKLQEDEDEDEIDSKNSSARLSLWHKICLDKPED